MWKAIWKIQASKRVKSFLCRVAKKIMPARLEQKGIRLDPRVDCFPGKLNLVEIDLIVVDSLDILFSLLNFSVLAVKRCKNKVVRGLVVVVRNVGSMSWFENVHKPVISIVFSELIDSKKKKKRY